MESCHSVWRTSLLSKDESIVYMEIHLELQRYWLIVNQPVSDFTPVLHFLDYSVGSFIMYRPTSWSGLLLKTVPLSHTAYFYDVLVTSGTESSHSWKHRHLFVGFGPGYRWLHTAIISFSVTVCLVLQSGHETWIWFEGLKCDRVRTYKWEFKH